MFVFSINRLGLNVNYITYVLGAAIALISIFYYATGKARREAVFIVVFLSVISINFLNYGKVFGVDSLTSYLNNSAVSYASILVTVVGGLLLTAMLLFFLYMYRLPNKEQ